MKCNENCDEYEKDDEFGETDCKGLFGNQMDHYCDSCAEYYKDDLAAEIDYLLDLP